MHALVSRPQLQAPVPAASARGQRLATLSASMRRADAAAAAASASASVSTTNATPLTLAAAAAVTSLGPGSGSSSRRLSAPPQHPWLFHRRGRSHQARAVPPTQRDTTSSSDNPTSSSTKSEGRSGSGATAATAKPAVGDVLQLRCTRLGTNATGICLHPASNFVVMVPRALPGELCEVQVLTVKSRYAEGVKLRTLEAHSDAVPPPCPHFDACGGCPLQGLSYEAQLREKRNAVVQLLARVGGVAEAERLVGDAVGAEEGARFGYRNKLQFTFGSRVWDGGSGSGGGETTSGQPGSSGAGGSGASAPPPFALGFLRPGTHNLVIPIQSCLLQGPAANRALSAVREEAQRLGLQPSDAPSGLGVLRHCIIRSAGAGAVHGGGGGGGATGGGNATCAASANPSATEAAADSGADSSGGGAAVQLQVVIVTTAACPSELIRPLADAVAARVPEVVSFVHSTEAAATAAAEGTKQSSSRRQQHQQQRGTQQRGRISRRTSSGGNTVTSTASDNDDDSPSGSSSNRGGPRALRVHRSVPLIGPPSLRQQLSGLSFKIGPHSFFQTNTRMAEVLYDLVGEAVGNLPGDESASVLDLYTGTGTIALSLAKRLTSSGSSSRGGGGGGDTDVGGKSSGSSGGSSADGSSSLQRRVTVLGADVNPGAIEDARRNAAANGVEGATFVCGDLDELVLKRRDLFGGVVGGDRASQKSKPPGKGVLIGATSSSATSSSATSSSATSSSATSSSAGSGKLGAIVVDPARSGLGVPVIEFLKRCRAPRIIYVSCNPATQARDVARLQGAYRLVGVTPVDLFPQTEHCETVAVLERC